MNNFIVMDGLVLIFLFFLSGLFSSSETALMGLGRSRLARAIDQGGAKAKALEVWRDNPNRVLTTILILNNAINITATTVATFFAFHLAESLHFNRAQMGALVAAMVTLIIIVFGEVTPKILAIHKSEGIVLALIQPLVFLEKVLRPLSRVLVAVSNLLLKPFGLQAKGAVPMITEEEIHALIQIGADEGIIEDQEHQMIHGVIQLGETQVREVMVPRTEMECIDARDNMEKIINLIIQTGYSRMPVYRESVDNIIGVIYTKDIISILQNRELIVLEDILRQPYFVPETKKIDELLHEFQRGKLHMAIIVDEYGGTSGLVTLEDLIEEIVGEIRDEYDIEEKRIDQVGPMIWIVDAQTDVKEINDALETAIPDMKDLNTIGGYLIHLLGHLPSKGEEVIDGDLTFTVLAASSRKVDRIQIQRLKEPEQDRNT